MIESFLNSEKFVKKTLHLIKIYKQNKKKLVNKDKEHILIMN